MGTTPNVGLPYPNGSDKVIQGDDAIQALAEAVDDLLYYGDRVTVAPAESSLTIGSLAGIDFPGTATLQGFTYSAGAFTYAGPPRVFMIDVSVEMVTGGTNLGTVDSAVYIRSNGTQIRGSYDRLDSNAGGVGTIQVRRVVHNLTTPGILQTGDVIDVIAGATPTAAVGETGIRIYPIGPAGEF